MRGIMIAQYGSASPKPYMPPRTNAFQKLVALVHTGLGPGWKVAESRMLIDSVTSDPREVDIVAESRVGEHTLFLCVECRDHGRPADMTWVEQMHTKHAHLPTSKLVLWSSSGFSDAAVVKASSLKIDTVSQADAAKTDWPSMARNLIDGFALVMNASFEKAFVDVELDDGSRRRYEATPGLLLRADSSEASVAGIFAAIRERPEIRTVCLDRAPEGAGTFYIEYVPPSPCALYEGSARLGRVFRMGVEVRTIAEKVPIDPRTIMYNGKLYTLATAKLSDGQFNLLVSETPDSPPNVVATKIPDKRPFPNE